MIEFGDPGDLESAMDNGFTRIFRLIVELEGKVGNLNWKDAKFDTILISGGIIYNDPEEWLASLSEEDQETALFNLELWK